MKQHSLTVTTRDTVGSRRVNVLRNQGFVPATVYGKGVENHTVQVKLDDFIRVFKETGETGLIKLTLNGKEHPVLIKNVQKHPVKGTYIHVEFHEVNLREKIKANVPVECIGESEAVKEKLGLLLQIVNELEVEALPTDLPEKIEIDVSRLAQVDQSVFVKDIPAIPYVEILTDPEQIVVKIGELTAPEPEPTPEATAEVPAEGTVEGTPDEEGEKQAPEETPEK